MDPQDLRYHEEHTWASAEDDTVLIGITDYAQDQLGDVVFVELPEVGEEIRQGQPFGVIESVKAVNDLYAPMSGEVVEVNSDLEDTPELVNEDPFGKGWIAKIKADDRGEVDSLMTYDGYQTYIKEEAEG